MPSSRKNQKKIKYIYPNRKNRGKIYLAIGLIAVAAVVISAFIFLGHGQSNTPVVYARATALTTPAGEYSANGTQVVLVTSKGPIWIQMRDDKPITTQNFLNLVRQGFYDGTTFHRVMVGFVIQGGQNQSTSVPSISDEIGNDNRNTQYTIAMAKTSEPNSATSEFFINLVDNGNLTVDAAGDKFDAVYSVFGTVISGQSVVNAIANGQVTTNPSTGEDSQPVNPVTVSKAIILP